MAPNSAPPAQSYLLQLLKKLPNWAGAASISCPLTIFLPSLLPVLGVSQGGCGVSPHLADGRVSQQGSSPKSGLPNHIIVQSVSLCPPQAAQPSPRSLRTPPQLPAQESRVRWDCSACREEGVTSLPSSSSHPLSCVTHSVPGNPERCTQGSGRTGKGNRLNALEFL